MATKDNNLKQEEYRRRTDELFAKIKQLKDPNDIIFVRNQIVQLNLPLVTTVLKKYRPYNEDQFQIGCLGLIKAADTYDIVREVPFANFACFVIERELHLDYKRRMETIEEQMAGDMVYLDAFSRINNDDEADNGSMIEDTEATRYMESFIEENALQVLCEGIIKPAIAEIADKGKKARTKINFEVWEKLEFRYIMSVIYEESQKKRFNMTKMAQECNISLPNVRARHVRVMDLIFQRMWAYMTMSFEELQERLRGDKKIPERLLCLDPGKTTGWAFFEKGKLIKWGQVPDCYDDQNIDASKLMQLFEELQPDFILYEDYRVYTHKLDRHSFSPVMTVRLLGVIEAYCQMKAIKTHKQMASTAKNFCTDAKLESWGFWKPGMRHSRDAIRHGCYFLLFYRKGEDIL